MRAGAIMVLLLAATIGPIAYHAEAGPNEAPLLSIRDPLGDVTTAAGTTQAPGVSRGFDIEALDLLEDSPQRLLLAIRIPGLAEMTRQAQDPRVDPGSTALAEVRFALEGIVPTYAVSVRSLPDSGACDVVALCTPQWPALSEIDYVDPEGGASQGADSVRLAYAGFDVANDRIMIEIDRNALVWLEPQRPAADRPSWIPRLVEAGSTFSSLNATFTYLGHRDSVEMDPAKQTYALAWPTVDHKLAIHAGPTAKQRSVKPTLDVGHSDRIAMWVGATLGERTTVPLMVQNLEPSKRVVLLETRVLATDDPGLELSVPRSQALSAHENRTLILDLALGPEARHRGMAVIDIIARDASTGQSVGHERLRILFATAFPEGNLTLHFHGRTIREMGPGAIGDVQVWANPLADDPEGTEARSARVRVVPGISGNSPSYAASLDAPAAHPYRLDAGGQATARFSLDSPAEMAVEAYIALDSSAGTIGAVTRHIELQEGKNMVTLPIPIDPAANDIAPLEQLRIRLSLRNDHTGSAGAWPAWDLGESAWVLPIEHRPQASPKEASSLRLLYDGVANSAEEFLNPGDTRAFPVTVANQGDHNLTVELEVAGVRALPGWSANILPAGRYLIPPGSVARVALAVTAPAEAGEGDRYQANLTARISGTPNAPVALQIVAISTRGIEIDEDSVGYRTDDATLDQVILPPAAEVPLPVWTPLSALALTIAWRVRKANADTTNRKPP